jgi:hypothetical protein
MEWNGVVRIFEYELNIAFEHSSYFFSLFHRSLVRSFARSVFGSLVLLLLIFDWHFS